MDGSLKETRTNEYATTATAKKSFNNSNKTLFKTSYKTLESPS